MKELVWHDIERRDAAAQMAIDLAMVEVARDENVMLLRLYTWQRDTVSFGAHEAASRRWDRHRLERDGVATVRRPTGGRAVWHDRRDLTYAWAGPVQGPREVRQRYRDLHQRLAAALAEPALTLELAQPGRAVGLGPGACFDVPAGGEVLVDGRKAIGSAQRVIGHHLLQHGAIAVADRGAELARYRLEPGPPTAIPRAPLPEASEVAARLSRHWLEGGAVPIDPRLTSRIVLASVKEQARLDDPAWTWRR
jgi:lipoate-protein ligase A